MLRDRGIQLFCHLPDVNIDNYIRDLQALQADQILLGPRFWCGCKIGRCGWFFRLSSRPFLVVKSRFDFSDNLRLQKGGYLRLFAQRTDTQFKGADDFDYRLIIEFG